MKIIGITGGIGSGKSVVLNILKEEYGAYVIETDRLAHMLMKPGKDAYNKIICKFGNKILDKDGCIDRNILGQVVFSDENKLNMLNEIIHPAVKEDIMLQIEKHKKEATKLFVIEAALLIQDGYKSICDELWYIYCDEELRIKRLVDYRGYTEEKARIVISNQENDSYYRNGCDVIIDNSHDIESVKCKIFSTLYR